MRYIVNIVIHIVFPAPQPCIGVDGVAKYTSNPRGTVEQSSNTEMFRPLVLPTQVTSAMTAIPKVKLNCRIPTHTDTQSLSIKPPALKAITLLGMHCRNSVTIFLDLKKKL